MLEIRNEIERQSEIDREDFVEDFVEDEGKKKKENGSDGRYVETRGRKGE